MTETAPQIEVLGPVVGFALDEGWMPLVRLSGNPNPFDRDMLWVAAAVGGRVAAVGALQLNWSLGRPWLGPSFVAEGHRGLGLQRLLIDARMVEAARRGYRAVASAVNVTNTASLRNMLNAGFRVTRYSPEHDHLELLWSAK